MTSYERQALRRKEGDEVGHIFWLADPLDRGLSRHLEGEGTYKHLIHNESDEAILTSLAYSDATPVSLTRERY